MPAKSEKQRKFFGAVMGAKKGQSEVSGAAKKAAKDMPEKEIKKFLKKESFDDKVNTILGKYFITEKEHCKFAQEGCDCDNCSECKANQE